ncbi:MAG: PocR ligand-binding domain-containing protein [Candidatus Omnitrophica bacterium]|nr:PocR ligand-binding domain-containing protein [Candidatus Omnitrophota bacterium]
MNHNGNNNYKVTLTDLIGVAELQEMQSSFAEVANVSLRIVDTKGGPVTETSNAPSLCVEGMRDNTVREKLCQKCLPLFLGGKGNIDDDFSFECMPGLRSYLVPLKIVMSDIKSLIVGYMVVGPVIFIKRKTKEEFEAIAFETGLDPYQLWNLVLELRVFSYHGIRSLLDMIENLTSHILTLAYSKLTMQKKISCFKVSQEEGFKALPTDEFLELFLDLIIDITSGSVGSVMLLDDKKKELVIKAAHGLPAEVVAGPTLKLGDGIAGLAAQTKKSFLINQDAADSDICGRLKRPQLFSSMIVPIKCREDVCGVVNISSDTSAPIRFDESSLAFVTKAAGLAGMALARIRS